MIFVPPTVTIYTDGGGASAGGPGGYGIVLLWGEKRQELSGGFADTTNGRMELVAAAIALEHLRCPCHVTLISDAQYLVNGINSWVRAWAKRNWRNANGQPTKNRDLWERILCQMDRHPHVEAQWVRGHNGDPENERCDALATAALKQPGLPPVPGFVRAETLTEQEIAL